MLPLLSSRRAKVTALLVTCLFSGHALVASPITVDGNWSDWGINPNAGVWTPTTGTRIFYENYTGTDGTGFVGPGWGGQYFDVEALYAMRTDNTFYFAVVTGFDPDGVLWQGTPYLAGDVFLDVGTGWNVGVDLQTGGLFTNVSASQSEIHPSRSKSI